MTPLGAWLDDDLSWQWYFCPTEDRLYQRQGTQWKYWILQRSNRRRCHPLFLAQTLTPTMPSSSFRATVSPRGQYTVMTGFGTTHTLVPPVPICSNLEAAIRALPPSKRWCLQEVTFSDDQGRELAQAIQQGKAIAVSDGSFKDSFGTAGWTLRGCDDSIYITGALVTPGDPQYQSAYRSEISGIYAILTITGVLCTLYDISDGSITIACDGESALDVSFDWTQRHISSKTPHFDLISAIRSMTKSSPLQWKYRHVAGHQDDFAGPLDRWAQLNVEMDALAKGYWAHATSHNLAPVQAVAEEPWSVWRGSRKFISPIRREVYRHIHSPQIHAYWQSRSRYTPDTQDDFDWEAMSDAMRTSPLTPVDIGLLNTTLVGVPSV